MAAGPRGPAAEPHVGHSMDRLDSLLPTAPVVWLLLAAFVGTG
ncbi:hypothetical protein ABZ766_07510 [Streptomyces sp. NPDC006670]